MPAPYRPSDSDSQEVRLVLKDANNLTLDEWTSYDISSDFLTPTDSFTFTLGLDEQVLTEEQRKALRFGARVRLHIRKSILLDGRIDAIEVSADRSSGTVITIRGRDRLGQTLDAVADPTLQLKTGASLQELLRKLFEPFGWSEDTHFDPDNSTNRDARAGKRGVPTTKGGKKKGPKPLKSFVLHQTKPYNHESVYKFASRITERHGLHIWPSVDGNKLIIGKPDFDQEAICQLNRARDGTGNIISGTITLDMTDQPTIIMADSFGGGGEFGKGRFKAYCVNPLLGFDENHNVLPEVQKIIDKYKGASKVELPQASFFLRSNGIPPRPMHLHDPESKTLEQLEAFVRREMSLLTRKGISANYVVEGHGQTIDNEFVTWTPDTIVRVNDEAADFNDDMYVLGVRFSKSRSSGTTTTLSLIPKHSIQF